MNPGGIRSAAGVCISIAAILSSAEGFKTRVGDRFEIEVPLFGRPLRNPMAAEADPGIVEVQPL